MKKAGCKDKESYQHIILWSLLGADASSIKKSLGNPKPQMNADKRRFENILRRINPLFGEINR